MRYLLLAALAASGCHKDKAAVFAPPASLFGAGDLEPAPVFTLSGDALKARLAASNQFYTREPALTGQDAAASCVRGRLATVAMTADRRNVTADAILDVKDCLAAPGVAVAEATYRLRYWLGCTAGDLAALDGQPLGDVSARACTAPGDYHVLIDLELVTDVSGTLTVTAPDGSKASEPYRLKARSLYALQMPTGDPCLVSHGNGAYAWLDDCEQVRRLSYVSYEVAGAIDGATGHDDYELLSFAGIKAPDSGAPLWFAAGKTALTWDNWRGSVTYSDAAAAPTWTMTSGNDTLTGTIASGASPLAAAPGQLPTLLR